MSDVDHDDAHRDLVRSGRQARGRPRRAPDGWLRLVDRLLRAPGDNPLPFGVATLRAAGTAADVAIRVTPGLAVTCDGRPITDVVVQPREGQASRTLVFDGRGYEVYRRGDTVAVRVKDPQSPALRGFTGLSFYPVAPAGRISARLVRYVPPRITVHQLDVGPSGPRQVPGLAHFSVAGQALALEPVLEEDAGRLFFVFADRTTGKGTSPAGRF